MSHSDPGPQAFYAAQGVMTDPGPWAHLLDGLHRLTEAGNTVIVIEHNLDVIRTADWIIDLGLEGGQAGGYIVAQGSPEEVVRVEGSYTGKFLSKS